MHCDLLVDIYGLFYVVSIQMVSIDLYPDPPRHVHAPRKACTFTSAKHRMAMLGEVQTLLTKVSGIHINFRNSNQYCTMVNKKQPITFIYLSAIYLISHWLQVDIIMISYCIFFGGITLFTININVVVQVHRNLHTTISMSRDKQQWNA